MNEQEPDTNNGSIRQILTSADDILNVQSTSADSTRVVEEDVANSCGTNWNNSELEAAQCSTSSDEIENLSGNNSFNQNTFSSSAVDFRNNLAHGAEIFTKTQETDIGEERDTFSPNVAGGYSADDAVLMEDSISPSLGIMLSEALTCNANLCIPAVDNKTCDTKQTKLISTKEEKQRQNEEIVILETSSVSSETGSWESIFPQKLTELPNDVTECSLMEGCAVPDAISASGSASVSGCFIDASTLLDEEEVTYQNLEPDHVIIYNQIEPNQITNRDEKTNFTSDGRYWNSEFGKNIKSDDSAPIVVSSSSSSCSNESSQKEDKSNVNNLSDEEKLWKREISKTAATIQVDIKDQYNKPSPSDYHQQFFGSVTREAIPHEEKVSFDASQSLCDELPMNIGEIKLRQDNEKKQGHLLFQNSIQQFSGHLISPKVPLREYSPFNQAVNNTWSNHTNHENVKQTAEDVFPETPHNSMVHVDSRHQDQGSISRQNDSGSFGSDSADSAVLCLNAKRSKCDESSPIISGGVSIKDFTPKQCESPPARRRTDACPIISGGFLSLDLERDDSYEIASSKQVPKAQPQLKQSWIVDMSDCKQSKEPLIETNTHGSINSGSYNRNSLGFYVSLNDMDASISLPSDVNKLKCFPVLSKSLNENSKKSTGFFVDLTESKHSQTSTSSSSNKQTPPISTNINAANTSSKDKKNIFSMFIDFGEEKISKREPFSLASRLSNSLNHKRNDEAMKNSSSSTETIISRSTAEKLDSAGETMVASSDESRKPSLQDVEGKARTSTSVVRRMHFTSSKENHSQRHSWNTNTNELNKFDSKRSTSLTGDTDLMSIIDKIPLIAKASSLSLESSISGYDNINSSKSELNTDSNSTSASSGEGEHASSIPKLKNKKRRKDVQINETFDKSSPGSLTDGIFSNKDISSASTTDTEDVTFQQVMETIIETKEVFSPKKSFSNTSLKSSSATHTMETLHATIEKQKQLLETVNENGEINDPSCFVKLSDMDKPVSKFELHSPETIMSKSVGNHRQINRLFGDSRVRPHSWSMTRSTGNSILNITNSVDNRRSLTRLFPHLSREFSNSLPTDMSLDSCNRIPSENDYNIHSDISTESSLASSISRSGMDESSISCRQPRRLGEDLLKMFLQELATDVTIEVSGRRIKAHKCILRSRCQYFAAMLAGGWVQSAGNVISLAGYSYSAVHFALCHIYSGASHPPDGISLMELAALADLLGLEGLKEVTAHALKTSYCHNFHKPCSGCIEGVLHVLPVALNHAIDDLYRKCLKWTCRHYLKIWPTKHFAQLPSDILGRCRQQVVAHLTSENVLQVIIDCDQLISQLAPCRWATVSENLVRDILDASYIYISGHFASLIASDSFLSLGHDKSGYIARLESVLLHTASSLTPDQSCRSYQRVTRLNTVLVAKSIKMPNIGGLNNELLQMQEEDLEWNIDFIRLVSAILSAVEQCLTRHCSRAMRVNSWQRMDLELRKKIQTLARLTEPMEIRHGKAVSKAFSFGGNTRNQDLYQVKLAIQAHSKRSLNQDTQTNRVTSHIQANAHEKDIQMTEKAVQSNYEGKLLKTNSKAHVPQSYQPLASVKSTMPSKENNNRVGHRRTQSEDSTVSQRVLQDGNNTLKTSRLSKIRPRYLQPRKPDATNYGPIKSHTSSNILSVKKGRHISSSDSSRTSSPATGRHGKIKINNRTAIGAKSINISLDSLATPSKRSGKAQEKSNTNYNAISVDSLAGSMKSSLKTDKTISQESLNLSNPISKRNSRDLVHQTCPGLSIACNKITSKFLSKNKSRQNTNSAGSSPSTTTTNKSSTRISSVNSANASPRDAFKHRSISLAAGNGTKAAGQPTPTAVRKSFISPKSREILARRAEKTKNRQANSSGDEKSHSSVASNLSKNTDIKNSNFSNIPTRRTLPPTTLHLRKTMKVASSPQTKAKFDKSGKHALKATDDNLNENKSIINGKESNVTQLNVIIDSENGMCLETKLERSSTFCKETSDLPLCELQSIE